MTLPIRLLVKIIASQFVIFFLFDSGENGISQINKDSIKNKIFKIGCKVEILEFKSQIKFALK